MTIALDVVTTSTANDASFLHEPVGTPRGVAGAWLCTPNTQTVSSMTYGGVELIDVSLSPLTSSVASETAYATLRLLGSSVPTGDQQFTIANSGNPFKVIMCATLTAAADIVEQDTATIDSASLDDPAATLSLSGNASFGYQAWLSGHTSLGSTSPRTNWTEQIASDVGGQTIGINTYDVIGAADITAGFISTSADDVVLLAAAFKEDVAGVTIPIFERHYRSMRA